MIDKFSLERTLGGLWSNPLLQEGHFFQVAWGHVQLESNICQDENSMGSLRPCSAVGPPSWQQNTSVSLNGTTLALPSPYLLMR